MTSARFDPMLAGPTQEAQTRRPDRAPRLLSGLTRARLLAILRDSGRARSVAELADGLGLHPNSVREQLGLLVTSAQVERVRSSSRGRGRPALRYRALPELDEIAPFRDLARLLADELARLPGGTDRALGAGERWGRAAIRKQRDHPDGEDRAATRDGSPSRPKPPLEPVERLVALLGASGFAPEPPNEGEPIRLRRCPFAPLAVDHRAIVCGVHLGLMRGALAELGAPLDAVRLEPYVEPDLCLAHLAARGRRAP